MSHPIDILAVPDSVLPIVKAMRPDAVVVPFSFIDKILEEAADRAVKAMGDLDLDGDLRDLDDMRAAILGKDTP